MQGISLLSILNRYDLPQSTEFQNLKKFCVASNEATESGGKIFNEVKTLNQLNLLIIIAGSIKMGAFIPPVVEKIITEDRHKMLIDYSKKSENGKYEIIPNVGHGIASEAPEIVTEIIKDYIAKIG
jgi:hypothetical protein